MIKYFYGDCLINCLSNKNISQKSHVDNNNITFIANLTMPENNILINKTRIVVDNINHKWHKNIHSVELMKTKTVN